MHHGEHDVLVELYVAEDGRRVNIKRSNSPHVRFVVLVVIIVHLVLADN